MSQTTTQTKARTTARAAVRTTVMTDAYERAQLRGLEEQIGPRLRVPGVGAAVRWLQGLVPEDRRLQRLAQLQIGLLFFGISDGMLLITNLGATPWDVFHQGLAKHLGTGVGTMGIAVGALVMLLWIPLRQKPGIGTLSNVVVVGLATNATMAWSATPHAMWTRWLVLVSGILLNGVATGFYIGAGLGPGPRDGLMTGYAARGHSIRVVRTAIEVTVIVSGWLLGGTLGVGTALFAVAIGPLAHRFIPLLALKKRDAQAASSTAESEESRTRSVRTLGRASA